MVLGTTSMAVEGDIQKREAAKEFKIESGGKLDGTAPASIANNFQDQGSDLCKFYVKFKQNVFYLFL